MQATLCLLQLLSFSLPALTIKLTKLRDGNVTYIAQSPKPNETLGELLNRMRDYQSVLVQAAQDVASLHRPARSSNGLDAFPGSVPRLDVDHRFMRSFTPSSGIGNREEVTVEDLQEVQIFTDVMGVLQWTYIRFNNTDCLLARLERHIIIWKLQISQYSPFEIGIANAFAVVETEYGSIDSIFYTKTTGYDRELYMAVLSHSRRAPTIHIYELRHLKLIPVTFMNLEEMPVMIGFVESQRGSAIANLIPRHGRTKVAPRQTGHAHQNIIKIYVQYPVDMVTFSVNGIGYVAVANDSFCEIFRFDEYLQDFTLFDRFYVHDIVDLETFHLGFHRFLAIVGAFEQHLLVWREGGFQPRQLLRSPNVARMQATYVGGCRDDVLLTALGGSRHVPLRLFLWQELEFVPLPDHGLASIFGNFQALVGSLASFTDNRTVFLLTTDHLSMKSRLFSIKTGLRHLPDPMIMRGAKVTDIMKDFENNLHAQERELQYFHEKLGVAVQPTGGVITAPQILNNLDALKQMNVAILNRIGPITWQGSELTMADLRWTTDVIEKDVMDLERQLNNMEKAFKDVAMKNEDAAMTGHKTFHGPFIADEMFFTTLDLPRVGDVNLGNLLSAVFRLDRPRPIGGTVKFFGDFRIRRNMDVNRINSIDVGRDVAVTNKPQEIQGTITFAAPFLVDGDMNIDGTVNGLDFLKDLVSLHGSHYIPAYKNFTSGLNVQDSVTSLLVDNVDLPKLVEEALTNNQEQVVHLDPMRMLRGRIGDLAIDGTLNGFVPGDLASRIVRVDTPSSILGPKHLLSPVFEGGLFVNGLYDNIQIPYDLMLNGRDQTITAPKYFGNVVVNHAVVGGMVDGLKLPEDIVTLTRDEVVARKIFANGIDIEGDLEIGRYIDGVDIRALDDMVKAESKVRPNVVFLGPTIVKGTLRIGSFAGIDLSSLASDLVFPSDKLIEFTGKKVILGDVDILSAEVKGFVNGYNLKEDFLNVHTDQIVRGLKTFLHGIEFGRNIITGQNLIGDVDIVDVNLNHISLSQPGMINGNLVFADQLTIEHELLVKGTIDDLILPGNAVIRDGDQVIGHKVFLNGMTTRELSVDGDLWVGSTVDAVDIDDFLLRRVTLSTEQTLLGNYVAGNLAAGKVETMLLNGVDLTGFAGKVMSLTRAQVVPVEFAFPGTTNVFGSMITTKGVNGIRLDAVNLKAVKLHGHVVLPSSVTFAHPLTVEKDVLVRQGKVNDVDLLRLDSDAVKKNGEFWLSGRNVFASGAHVKGNVEAEFVNGAILPVALLLKHGDQTITGYHHFGDVDVAGHMNNLQLVNGHDLSAMQHSILRTDRPNNVTGSLIFLQPLNIPGHLQTSGAVNGVKVSALPLDAVQKWGEQGIEGNKKILGPVEIFGDLDVEFINGVKIRDFLNDVVYISGHQEIGASKTFLSPLSVASNLHVDGRVLVSGLVDRVDLAQVAQDAVYLNEPTLVSGSKEFADVTVLLGSLNFNGEVNGIDLADVVVLNTHDLQELYGTKVFSNVYFSSPVDVKGYVNGNNLPNLLQDTFMTGWDQSIPSHKILKGRVSFLNPVQSKSVNGMNLAEELIFLRGNRGLPRHFAFLGGVNVAGNLETSGLINGVDLRRLAEDALSKSGAQVVTGNFHLGDAVFETNVGLHGRLNGIPLPQFSKEVDAFQRSVNAEEQKLDGAISEHERVSGYLESIMQGSLYTLDYFTLHQVLHNTSGLVMQTGGDLKILTDSSLQTFFWGQDSMLGVVNALPAPTHARIFFLNGVSHAIQRTNSGTLIFSGNEEPLATLPPSDVVAFLNIDDLVLIAIGSGDLCRVYRFRFTGLEEVGKISAGNSIVGLEIFLVKGQVYIAVGTSYPTNCLNGLTHVYLWHDGSYPLAQNVEGLVTKVVPFTKSSFEYILMTTTDNMQRSNIQLMRSCDCCESGFLEVKSVLPVGGFVDMELFEVGTNPEIYLAVANQTDIQIFLLAGASGFQLHSTIRAKDITSIRSFHFGNDLYLVVGQGKMADGSLVYRGVMKGSNLKRWYRRWS